MSAPTYSFKKEEIDEFGVKVETIDYGDISNSTLLRAFGDQMTYNDLKLYARDEEGCGNLVCVYRWSDEKTLQFKAIRNGVEILQKSFDRLAMGLELFYILNELETELETREDEERVESCKKSTGSKAPRKMRTEEAKEEEEEDEDEEALAEAEEIEEALEAEWIKGAEEYLTKKNDST
jgi:hypothetical protein